MKWPIHLSRGAIWWLFPTIYFWWIYWLYEKLKHRTLLTLRDSISILDFIPNDIKRQLSTIIVLNVLNVIEGSNNDRY